jgi:hypothetical protein
MSEDVATTRKCAHPPCTCQVERGNMYCSPQCAAMEKTPDFACECHHTGCKDKIGSYFGGAVPASVYSPVQVYSNPPSAVPVVLQVPDPLVPFIFPVPPVI